MIKVQYIKFSEQPRERVLQKFAYKSSPSEQRMHNSKNSRELVKSYSQSRSEMEGVHTGKHSTIFLYSCAVQDRLNVPLSWSDIPTFITVVKITHRRHAYRQTSPRQPFIEILFLGDSRFAKLILKIFHHSIFQRVMNI